MRETRRRRSPRPSGPATAGPPATWPRSRDEPLTSLRAAASAPGNQAARAYPPPRAGQYQREGGMRQNRQPQPPEHGPNPRRVTPGEMPWGWASSSSCTPPKPAAWFGTGPSWIWRTPGGDLPRHHSRHGGHRAGRGWTGGVRQPWERRRSGLWQGASPDTATQGPPETEGHDACGWPQASCPDRPVWTVTADRGAHDHSRTWWSGRWQPADRYQE